MLLFGKHRLIRLPKIGVTLSGTGCMRNGFPQTAAGLCTALSHGVCHDLPRLSTQGDPDPRLLRLLQHTRAIRSSNSRTVASASLASGGISVSRKRWQLGGLVLSRRSLRSVTLQRSARVPANCFALQRLSESLRGVLLHRHVASAFHDFASCLLCNDISACRWELARFASRLRFRNEDKRQCSLPWHLPPLIGFFLLLYHCIPFLTTTQRLVI
jgi:hypothetical protein